MRCTWLSGFGYSMVFLGIWGIGAFSVSAGAEGAWTRLCADENWYRQERGNEQIFRGTLEAVPNAGGPSALQRTSYYRLGERTIYTGAKKVEALERLVGKAVEIRGKPVDMNLEGQALKEIWPAAVRPAAGSQPAPKAAKGKPRPSIRPAMPAVGEPSVGPAVPPAAKPGNVKPQWNEAPIVLIGKLDRVDAGPVGFSEPPLYTHTLHFTVSRVLRGVLEPGAQIACSHAARQAQRPVFPVGELCLVAAKQARGRLQATLVEKADPKRVAAAEASCNLPLGWRMKDGKPVSPWAPLGEEAWPEGSGLKAELVCSVTGRPALLAGGVKLTVEPVPPSREIKWTNPDGDGAYKVTVTNETDKPIEIPALLSSGGKVLWANSVVILCQGKAYVCPGFDTGVKDVAVTKLDPGESASGVVNALALEGPEWPRGGYRIEFQFCLGELTETESFYYMSRHHDKVRQKLKGQP